MEPTGVRRVGRPSVSCTVCRKRKLKCDREFPCANCLRSRSRNPRDECVYDDPQSGHRPRRRAQSPGQRQLLIPPYGPSPASSASAGLPQPSTGSQPTTAAARLLSVSDRNVPRPEPRQFDEPPTRYSASPASTEARGLPAQLVSQDLPDSPVSETVQSHRLVESNVFGETVSLANGTAHKSRLFGQSHWITAVAFFRDLIEMAASQLGDDQSRAGSGMRKCKTLSKAIKAGRTPAWPTPPTATLPSRELADELVENYLRTTESVYRVLHTPSFRRDYEALWLRAADAPPDRAFLVQIKLVLAIGAVTYDSRFSLRTSAIRWIYEAQTYLSDPKSKPRLGLQSLQTNILLLIAREVTGIDGDSLWVSAGALFRSAMQIGLHRDPTTLFGARKSSMITEMRRRLWNSVLEIALQSSLASGKPPLISLGDFDTRPPGNFADDQLMIGVEDPVPQPDARFTQMTIPIALRKTFTLRLRVARLLNDPSFQGTYEETLKLDAELRAAYRDILQSIQPFTRGVAPRFETCVFDVIMHRCIASLHVPFLGTAFRETTYAYSRRVVVDSALRIWYAATSSWPSTRPSTPANPVDQSCCVDFNRFTICGSGFFRTAAFLANLVIAAEVKAQLQEEASLGPVILRPDLLAVLEDWKAFSLRAIEAGETNVKGYLFSCLVGAQVEGLQQQVRTSTELPGLVIRAAEDAVEKSLQLLETIHRGAEASEEQLAAIVDPCHGMVLNTPSETIDDWDSLMTDALFNSGHNSTTDPMGWMLMEDLAPESSSW